MGGTGGGRNAGRTAEPRPERLVDAVVDHVERLIINGDVRPGGALPSAEELADRLHVASALSDRAVAQMVERGLIEVTEDGRTVVVGDTRSNFSTPLAYLLQTHQAAAYDYLEFRCVIEGEAARLAAERGTDEDRENLRRRFALIEAMHQRDDPSEEADADAEFHLAIYEMTRNVVLLHIMRGFSSMLRKDVFYSRGRIYARPGVRETLLSQHRAIFDAIMAGDADAAAKAAADHMRFTRGTIEEMNQADARLEASLRRLGRSNLVATE